MYRLLCLYSLLLMSACPAIATHGDGSLSEAKQQFFQHQIKDAYQRFETLAVHAKLPEERPEAIAWLVLFDWRYYQRFEQARKRLKTGLTSYPESPHLWEAACRFELEQKRYAAAIAAGKQAVRFAEDDKDQRSAKLLLATARMQESLDRFWETGTQAVSTKADLAEAIAILKDLLKAEPHFIDAAQILLTAAMLSGNGQEATRAWQAYYEGLSDTSPFPQMIQHLRALQTQLQPWRGSKLDPSHRDRIIETFLQSRMFLAAAIIATMHSRPENPSGLPHKAITYYRFLESLKDKTNEYYRLLALDEASFKQWERDIVLEAGNLWSALKLGKPWPAPETLNEAVLQNLRNNELPQLRSYVREHFGAYFIFGQTAGYDDMHYGHIVHEETKAIEQYGQRGEITFLILDHMMSNGFQSWAWDFHMQHGGWARTDTIIQIRSDASSQLQQAWLLASDDKAAATFEKEIQQEQKSDLKLAKSKNIVYLPGVAKRLRLDGIRKLYQKMKSENPTTDLESDFKRTVRTSMVNAAIFAHEGRHVIDKRKGIRGSTELEYLAKLSEITFAELPKLSLVNNIFASNLGSETPHGMANKRVMKGIVAWMKKHRSEIKDFDAAQPVLLQLPLLTDEQLRQAVRTMDPLAKKP